MTVVAGLDLSLNHTGLVVAETGMEWRVLDDSPVITPKKLRGIERLQFLRDTICEVFDEYDAEIVLMEGYGFGAKNQAHSLGEAGGVVKLAIGEMEVPVVIVPPSVLKKFLTGKGNAKKDLMILNVYKKWAYETEDDNTADAYTLARFAYHYHDQTLEEMPKYLQQLVKDKGIEYIEPLEH